MLRKYKKIILILIFVVALFGAADLVLAQAGDLTGIEFGEGTGLSQVDPRIVAARVIRAILGFLGILAVGLIIYGGWMYMTSEGNEEKMEKAKKLLRNAVIGLIVILSAFGIASFILSRLLSATGGGGGGGSNCGDPCYCGGHIECDADGNETGCFGSRPDCDSGGLGFIIKSTSPYDGAVNMPRNVVIEVLLNRSLSATTSLQDLKDNFKVVWKNKDLDTATTSVNQEIGGNISTSSDSSVITFYATSTCENEMTGETVDHCLPSWSEFEVTINSGSGLKDYTGVNTLNSGNVYVFSFATNNSIDTEDPITQIVPMQICEDDDEFDPGSNDNIMSGIGSDDTGIRKLRFYFRNVDHFYGDDPYSIRGNTSLSKYFSFDEQFASSTMVAGETWEFKVEAIDLVDHFTEATTTTRISPGHCCNGVLDPGEDEVDCGGDCLACVGGPCHIDPDVENTCSGGDDPNCVDGLCSTFFCDCTANGCLCDAKPFIDWISPEGGFCKANINAYCQNNSDCGAGGECDLETPNGKATINDPDDPNIILESGTIVTVQGENFGDSKGTGGIYFTAVGDTKVEGLDPTEINSECTDSWSDTQLITVVPEGADYGPIYIKDNRGYWATSTDIFVITDIERPGICALQPDNEGNFEDSITYQGNNLTGASAYFGDSVAPFSALNSSFLNNLTGSAQVPSMSAGMTSTFVTNNAGIDSNYLDFLKLEEEAGMRIDFFNPTQGTTSQYVTIKGSGFGEKSGSANVLFGADDASFDFPAECTLSGLWSDKQITVKVPENIPLGDYVITVINSSGETATTELLDPSEFSVANLPLAPGLCSIEPIVGPTQTSVTLVGEYFKEQSLASVQLNNIFVNTFDTYNGPNPIGQTDNLTFKIPTSAQPGNNPVYFNSATTTPTPCAISADCSDGYQCSDGKCQLVSNSKDYFVGYCYEQPGICDTQFCCPKDSTNEGQCMTNEQDCYAGVKNSVYEFEFRTGVACGAGEIACGTSCCSISAGGCEAVPNSNRCKDCAIGENKCDDGDCCVVDCVGAAGNTTCPVSPGSCSGYSFNQCNDSIFCPNSPGKCSPYPGGQAISGVSCDCDGLGVCTDATCSPNASLNRCLLDPSVECDLATTTLASGYTAVCASTTNPKWQINNITTSCPSDDWRKIAGDICVHKTLSCDICADGFACIDDNVGPKGVCGINKILCSGGVCNTTTGICESTDAQACECCCEIGQDDRDCCYDQKCEGTCGADNTDDNSGFGMCSGCANAGATQAEHDLACNCTGHTGKYCDTADPEFPDGVCRDCAQLSSFALCNAHNTTCCADAENSDICRGGNGSLLAAPNIGYCPYYSCSGNTCAGPATTGTYINDPDCGDYCGANPPGSSCYDETANACTISCMNPYNCMGESGCIGFGPAPGCGANDESCTCCCERTQDPADDECKIVNNALDCRESEPCDKDNRGLCCGCSIDSECVPTGTLPETVGCGNDACCRARPQIIVKPLEDRTKVCRNAQISATFNEKMDVTSFTGNMIVVGDYEDRDCGTGTEYLVLGNEKKQNIFVRTFRKIARLVMKVVKPVLVPIIGDSAYAQPFQDHNYCAIKGTVTGFINNNGTHDIIFSPSSLLAASTTYYAIVKGDDNYDSVNGVKNYYGIGMIGMSTEVFNGVEFASSTIWSFTTMKEENDNDTKGVCVIERVEVDPNNYLFQTHDEDLIENDSAYPNPDWDIATDNDKAYLAQAYSSQAEGNLVLSPVTGYSWDWIWSVEDWDVATSSAIGSIGGLPENQTLVTADPDITEGKTKVNATADISDATFFTTENIGADYNQDKTGTAIVRVFICNNPWPAIDGGVWEPWTDQANNCQGTNCPNTNFELYYCRDAGEEGVLDDLPVVFEDPVIGTSTGLDIMKEFYFFREDLPELPIFSLTTANSLPAGQGVTLSWTGTSSAVNYIIAYRSASPNFDNFITTNISGAGSHTYTVSQSNCGDACNLANGTEYHFAIIAKLESGVEVQSNEQTVTPTVTQKPSDPIITSIIPKDKLVEINWTSSSQVAHTLYFLQSIANISCTYDKMIKGNEIDSTPYNFGPLNNGTTYCFGIEAKDNYGNISTSSIHLATPFENVKGLGAISSEGKVELSWSESDGAGGYKVYVKKQEEDYYLVNTAGDLNYDYATTTGERLTFKVTSYLGGFESEGAEIRSHAKVAPYNLSAETASGMAGTFVTLSWGQLEGAVRYKVQSKESTVADFGNDYEDTDSSSWQFTDLASGTEYNFQVISVYADDYQATSSVYTYTVPIP